MVMAIKPVKTVWLLGVCLAALSLHVQAQGRYVGQRKFPVLKNTPIPGAPVLGAPTLIMGATMPVMTEKHGLAAPLAFDWNGDGRKDLLIGEFETSDTLSNVRVYLNKGTDAKPTFTDDFVYARDTEGTKFYVKQWCCIGFTPQLVDLDCDGYPDIITGQYHPGHITWFRGSAEGFLPGVRLPQIGDPEHDRMTSAYWVYSSATMGDVDGDGLPDLVLGGSGGLRWSKNIGTRENPSFGYREFLYDAEGEVLDVYNYNEKELADIARYGKREPSGDSHTSPVLADWDGDGVPDLLVTNSFRNAQLPFVTFFRGIRMPEGPLRFQKGIPLFTAADGSKPFPGSGPRVNVCDWNNDGILDLVIGASVPTLNDGVFSDHLAWTYEDITRIQAAGKDPGRLTGPERERALQQIAADTLMKQYYLGKEGNIDYLTMRHRGYIYVMPGSKPKDKAVPVDPSTVKIIETPTVTLTPGHDDPAVNFEVIVPESFEPGGMFEIEIVFTLEEGWYIYSPALPADNPYGMAPLSVEFKLPRFFYTFDVLLTPEPRMKGLMPVFDTQTVRIRQKIDAPSYLRESAYPFTCTVRYQACNPEMCKGVVEETIEFKIKKR